MVFSKSYCPFCSEAKSILEKAEVPFSVIELDKVANGPSLQSDLQSLSGQSTVPNIFVAGQHIGGLSDLKDRVQEKKF